MSNSNVVKCVKCGNDKTFNAYSWARNIEKVGSKQGVIDTYLCRDCRPKKSHSYVKKVRESEEAMRERIRQEILNEGKVIQESVEVPVEQPVITEKAEVTEMPKESKKIRKAAKKKAVKVEEAASENVQSA